jgi:hypothetical protein
VIPEQRDYCCTHGRNDLKGCSLECQQCPCDTRRSAKRDAEHFEILLARVAEAGLSELMRCSSPKPMLIRLAPVGSGTTSDRFPMAFALAPNLA